MIAAAVIRIGVIRREREAAVAKQQREAEIRRKKEQEKYLREAANDISSSQPRSRAPLRDAQY